MIHSHVGDGGSDRVEILDESQLETRNLNDQAVDLRTYLIAQRAPDVPGGRCPEPGFFEHRRCGLGDARLPVRPCHSGHWSFDVTGGEFDLAPDRHPRLESIHDRSRPLRESRAGDDQVHSVEQSRIPGPGSHRSRGSELPRVRVFVIDGTRHSQPVGESCRRLARDSGSEDQCTCHRRPSSSRKSP